MPDIETAMSKTKSLHNQIKPYESYAPGPTQDLATIIQLLETPSEVNIKTALEKLEAGKKAFEGFRAMAPALVDPMLKLCDEIIEALTKA